MCLLLGKYLLTHWDEVQNMFLERSPVNMLQVSLIRFSIRAANVELLIFENGHQKIS